MNTPLSIPAFDSLPNSEEVIQITQWLSEAGLSSLELSNVQGVRLRITVEESAPPTPDATSHTFPTHGQPEAAVSTSTDISVTAPYFGNLLRKNPLTKEEFAPSGSSVCAGEVVSMLQIGELTVSITAPQNGTVVQFMAEEGDLISYGQTILTLHPL
ncbi:acetyl-CoA carboxylase biotin carboxyl carrier protein [Acetobacter senegalensis]|uniref:Acetyl-CoA carboxylase biotin carboxyl carrier protein n=1 Tax=Acetobacter senegalensis TaxID=446692 RepID=A0A0U5BD88_9PROT|nr:biotin/lipoyl-containing protein [Acetobacter senegalensis]CEF42515.1 acetyl-CoA carboxylase biotin carboxyl carrier protein [Acetobacter senegalensis]